MEVCPGNLQRRHRRPALRVEIRLEDGISRQNQRYARSQTVLARLARDHAAMGFDNLTAKIESDTGTPRSALVANGLLFHAKEFVEDPLAERGRNSRSAIRHGDLHQRLSTISGILHGRSDRNRAAARRVLERVAQKIDEDHRQSCRIAKQESGLPVASDVQFHFSVLESLTKRRHRALDYGVKINAVTCKAKLSRLNPGQIQQLVDSARQFVASKDSRGENLVLPGRKVLGPLAQ